jgi:hypothetical protein
MAMAKAISSFLKALNARLNETFVLSERSK